MSFFPVLRFELDSMRFQIRQALSLHYEELTKAIDASFEDAMRTMDLEHIIQAEVDKQLPLLLRDMVQERLQRKLSSPTMQKAVDAAIQQSAKKVFT